jgi:TP901 family phage tail tape measure protein
VALKLGELSATITADDKPMEEGLERAEGRFQKFGDRLSGVATGVGAAAALALGMALVGAMELDAAKAKFAAQLGGSAEYAQEMGEVAGRLYTRGFAASAGEAMESVRAVLNSGLVSEDADNGVIEEITRKAQALATTFDVEVNAATRAAGQLMRNGLAKDADEAFDIVTRGFQQTGDQAGDLLDTYSEYSTQFRKLGLDGAQATGLLSQGLKAGARDVDTVADALKEFSIRAVDGSTASAAGFKALGLNAGQMTAQIAAGGAGATRGLDTILDRLRAMQDPVARDAAAVGLFGTKAEDLGAALLAMDVDSAAQALGDVEGAAGKMADTLEQSASQQLEAFKRQAQEALVEQMAKAVPYIKDLAGWLKENKEIVGPLAATLGILGVAIAAIVAAVKVWTIVQTALNIVLAMNPIGLLIIGVALIIAGLVLLWTKVDGFRGFWIGAWNMITGAASATWNWIKEKWPLILAILTGPIGMAVRFIAKHWESIKKGAGDAWHWVTDKWGSLVDWFAKLPGRISGAARGMWDGIKVAFRSALNWLIGAWNGLSFGVPGFSFAGVSVPGVSVGTPDIPYLATGGTATAGGMAWVGERGKEAVYLPAGASVRPTQAGDAGSGRQEVVHRVVLQYPDGRVVRELLIDHASTIGVSPASLLPATG